MSQTELERVATALEHTVLEIDRFVQVQRGRLRFFRTGLFTLLGLAVVLVIWASISFTILYVKSESNRELAVLSHDQTICYDTVQGHYVENIGLLADANGAVLRGEPPNRDENVLRVRNLRAASALIANIGVICHTYHPDATPLDGDVDNDGRADIDLGPR